MVEPDPAGRERIAECIGGDEFQVTAAASGQEALDMLAQKRRRLPGARLGACPTCRPSACSSGLDATAPVTTLPVIVYSRRARRSTSDDWPGSRLADSVTVRQVYSPERLLDQTAFFLHSPVDKLPEAKRRMLEELLPDRQGAAGQEGADRRRRHPQHLRADQHPGGAQHGDRLGRHRPRRHQASCRPSRTSTSC